MMKVCTKCGINHPLNNFNYRKESSDNLTSWCKNCLSIKNKKWAIDNKDYLSEKRKRLRQENPEKYKNAFKEWYDKNSESQRKRANNYRIENPEKVKQRFKKWAYNKRKNDTEYKILTTLRNRINNVIKRQNGEKAFSVIELTGCTVKELKQHLENQFRDGMDWDNHSTKGWHIDHIIPCCKFDLTNPEEQKKCFHYTNLQPLWWYENLEKRYK